MFGISSTELIVILLVALVVLGPEKLPGVVRKTGQIVSELKKISSGFEHEMRSALVEPEPVKLQTPEEPRAVQAEPETET